MGSVFSGMYYYNVKFNSTGFMFVVALIATIVLTILAYKFIVPEKRRAKLNKLGQFIHDLFNFKFLILEKIFRFFYILFTIAIVCVGISMIFGLTVYENYSGDISANWSGIAGILIALLGPVLIRIVYESLIMFILLVKNVIQINKKLKDSSGAESDEYQMPKLKDLVSKENFDFIKKSAPADEAAPADEVTPE